MQKEKMGNDVYFLTPWSVKLQTTVLRDLSVDVTIDDWVYKKMQ